MGFQLAERKYEIVACPVLPQEAREILKGYRTLYLRYADASHLVQALNAGTEVLIIVGLRIDKSLLRKSKGLKLIITRSSGLDNIDLDEAERMGICVANQPEAIAEAVSEYIISTVLALLRYILIGHLYTVTGEWQSKGWPESFRGGLIIGKRIGFLGFGRIAHLTAIKFIALGATEIYYWSRSRQPRSELVLNAVKLPLEGVIRRSDILVSTLPDTKETHHLLTFKLLKMLPEGAVFVNVGRGGVIEPGAIEKLLENRDDIRVVLDVHEKEPLSASSKLVRKYAFSSRVILTPHIAGYSEESMRGTALLAALQARKFLTNRCVWNPVTKTCTQCEGSPPSLKEIINRVVRYKGKYNYYVNYL